MTLSKAMTRWDSDTEDVIRRQRMRVLVVHNYYQIRGGEDNVVEAEIELLESYGHSVDRFEAHNNDAKAMSSARLTANAFWSRSAYRDLVEKCETFRPDVVHVHNTWPLLSPAIYYAAKSTGVAVVQTLHNYRLGCVNGLFFRDGHACTDCLGKPVAFLGVVRACYRQSVAQSGVVAGVVAAHRIFGTYNRTIDRYIVLSEFSRQLARSLGLQSSKLRVKPNFSASPEHDSTDKASAALYVGRISTEKGVHTMLKAWKNMRVAPKLKVIGDYGEDFRHVYQDMKRDGVHFLGPMSREDVLHEMSKAQFLVFPSECFENFPRVIVEAFACGLPVVASRLGAMAELVEDGRTGLLFSPGDADDLAEKVRVLLRSRQLLDRMQKEARKEYLSKYTPERNYEQLIQIYEEAVAEERRRKLGASNPS